MLILALAPIFIKSIAQSADSIYLFPSAITSSKEYYQWKATQLSFVGEYEKSNLLFDSNIINARKASVEKLHSGLSGLDHGNAHDFIIQAAKDKQILIINEAHHKPQHRVFTESLLADLYKVGFRYLGLETLINDFTHEYPKDTALNTRKYPLLPSGTYTQEPNFGNLLRTALQVGYQTFSYEASMLLDKTPREEDEARNIANFLKEHAGAKILIHCGYGHASECFSAAFNSKTMAGFLKEYTGIDPFTIDQNSLTEDLENEFSVFKPGEIVAPQVFFTSGGRVVNDAYLGRKKTDTCFDVLVFHPLHMLPNRRPGWKLSKDYVEFNPGILSPGLSYPIMIKAYHKAEEINQAIPADIIIRENKQDKKPLNLKKGDYVLLVSNLAQKKEIINISVQ
ncbi:MAG: hypothetical protein ABIY51_09685 [Ferruginibacter sp.]